MLRINERQIFYVLLIVSGGFFLSMAHAIPSAMGVAGDPGAGFMPFWISLIIMLLVGYLLVMETFFQRDSGALVGLSRHEAVALGVTLLSILLYLLLLSVAGFVASTLCFLFAFRQIVDRFVKRARPTLRSLLASAVFSGAATGFIYLVFSVLFELSLP
ncbi:hypothetical protein A8C75_19500 [Marinobacterium aestuarii]|uniref:DUF1468 domain-containing protein n=1 Tax=Marinobacterium aestuarii TaxID=1821621 RepID=A0A1A9F3L0_9GAMM|nr:tripartite tricarboxylate transporter TctB family protein [Marinobacterium aestuarii]ANG64441.1 hypothetical protein A8C75_19500 [Marinobacterium aestuarii]